MVRSGLSLPSFHSLLQQLTLITGTISSTTMVQPSQQACKHKKKTKLLYKVKVSLERKNKIQACFAVGSKKTMFLKRMMQKLLLQRKGRKRKKTIGIETDRNILMMRKRTMK
jgi:hypothetical protein